MMEKLILDVEVVEGRTYLDVERGIHSYSSGLEVISGDRRYECEIKNISYRRLVDVDPWIIKFHVNPRCRSYGSLFSLLGGSGKISEMDIVTLVLFRVNEQKSVKESDSGTSNNEVSESGPIGDGKDVTVVKRRPGRKRGRRKKVSNTD